jgi:hypothetical protein
LESETENNSGDLSSFEKGIFNKLNENEQVISILMSKYIVGNNSKWHSNDFPSSQIAKTILGLFKTDEISFPVMHRIVKEILKTWEDENLCIYIRTTKYGHCRKTKDIYRFNDESINKLKEILIHHNINIIKDPNIDKIKAPGKKKDVMKSRKSIIEEIRFNYEDILYDYINTNEDTEEK